MTASILCLQLKEMRDRAMQSAQKDEREVLQKIEACAR